MWYNFPNSCPRLWASSKTFSGTLGNVSHHALKVASKVWKEADSHLKALHWPFLDLTGPEYIGAENWNCTLQMLKKTIWYLLFSLYCCRELGTRDRILLLDPVHRSVPCKHHKFRSMGLWIKGRNLSWLCVWFLFSFLHKHKIHF